MERLQKIISAAGVASRRKAEELITSGLVQVNGQIVTELGTKADAAKDHIRVDGKLLKFSGHHVYILLNKPKGYVTTLSDPEGRPTIVDLLRGVKTRVYPIGRLDYASEGLLLLTNDGELANALTKAASHVPKTYLVKVSGQPSDGAIEQLRSGIALPDRKGVPSRTAPAGIKLVHKAENPWYEVTLIEGRNRQVRAMFEQTGHHVEKLKRVRYGPFTLDVHPGEFRNLLPEEVAQLRAAIHRGSSATAEVAVRPADRPGTYTDTELREAATAPAKFPAAPALVRVRTDKPKRMPKPLGTFASGPRSGLKHAEQMRPGQARSGAFRGNDFGKKGPRKVKFRRDSVRGGPPFQKRFETGGPSPVHPPNTHQRPTWNKRPYAARFGKPRNEAVRSDARDDTRGKARGARPDAPPARQGSDARPPFWQGADKRRPRTKEESAYEQRPAARSKRLDSRKPDSRKPDSRKPGPRKHGAAKFKNRPR